MEAIGTIGSMPYLRPSNHKETEKMPLVPNLMPLVAASLSFETERDPDPQSLKHPTNLNFQP